MRCTTLALLVTATCAVSVAGVTPDLEWRLYLATIAAADGALRTNETSAALHWLGESPRIHRGWEWRFLAARSDQSLFERAAHAGPVTGVAVSRDGQWAASTSGDGTVKVWDARTGALSVTLEGHGAATWSPAFRPGAPQVASMGSDGSVRVWDWARREETRRLEKLGRGMGALAWSPDGALLCAATWTLEKDRGVVGWVHLWNVAEDRLLWKAEYGVKPITAVAFRPDGRQFAVVTWDAWVGMFSVDGEGRTSAELRVPMGTGTYPAMQSVAYAADGATLVATSKDGLARQVRTTDGTVVRELAGHARWVNGVAFEPAGRWIATGSSDETIRLWAAGTGVPLRTIRGHRASVNALAVTPDGAHLISGAADGTLRWWDARLLADTDRTTWKAADTVYGVDVSPDGGRVALASWGGHVAVRDAATGRTAWQAAVHESSANAVAFSRDGRTLVTGGNDGRLRLLDAANGNVLATWEKVEDGRAAVVTWSPDGRFVFAPSSRPNGKIWDASTGRLHATVTGAKGEIYDAAFSPDGRHLLLGWTNGDARVVDAATGADALVLPNRPGGVHAVAWAPGGDVIATGGGGRAIDIWEARSGRPLRTLEGHTELVYDLDFSPDGSRLVSASTDQTVRLWAPARGDAVLSLPFAAQVYGAQFSPDGHRLFVLPMDGTVVVLDAPAAVAAPSARP